MSLIKYINPDDWDFGEPTLNYIDQDMFKSASYWRNYGLSKQASMDVSDIKYEPDTVKVHLIALGSGEYWGANRNGDFFPEDSLIKYHDTFVKFGNFHKNHKNKPYDTKYGWVEKSWYNPKMKRVELVAAVDLTKYPDFKSKLESGKDIPVSMAAKLPYDICSICGHRRTKPGREHTCKHVNDELCKVYSDGRMVFAINEKPKFFDISEVWRPADRTAYVLRKVASDLSGYKVDLPEKKIQISYSGLNKLSWDKLAFLNKLSELEKRVDGEIRGKVKDGRISVLKLGLPKLDIPDNVLEAMSDLPKNNLYASLADKGVILKPREFFKVNKVEDSVDEESLKPLLRNIFSKIINYGDVGEYIPDNDYDLDSVPDHSKVSRIFSKVIPERSIFTKPVIKRISVVIIRKLPKSEDLDDSGNFDDIDLCEGSENNGSCEEDSSLEKESSFSKAAAISYALYKASALKYILDKEGNNVLNLENVPAIVSILENNI